MNLKIIIPLLIVLSHMNAYGQSRIKKAPRTTQLNFEDELIEGNVSSPDLLFILKSKNANYGRLLKLRDHFLPEINATKYDILRGSK